MTVEGDVTIFGAEAASVIRHLTGRISTLEGYLAHERRSRSEEVVKQIPEVIKYLRIHSVVLLYAGQGRADELVDQINDQAALAALDQAWNLDNAPLPQSVITQVSAATLGGMNRF